MMIRGPTRASYRPCAQHGRSGPRRRELLYHPGQQPVESAMPQLERATVSLHYRDEGQGDPPLLLLHGWCDSSATWDSTLAAFRGEHRCIAPDMRGHGQSGRPIDHSYSLDALSGDAVAICEAAGVSRPVVIGHSFGGVLAAEIARRFPAFPRGVIVVDQPLDIGAFSDSLRPAEAIVRSLETHMAFREQVYREICGPTAPPALADAIVARGLQTPADIGMALWAPLFEMTDAELAERGAALIAALSKLPSLSIEHDDPAGYHAALNASAPSIGTELLPAGHWIHEERPAEFQAVIRRFLASV